MKILIVGGSWDKEGGRPSGLINKLSDNITGHEVTVENGGYFVRLKELLESTVNYNCVFWFANVPNTEEKIRDVKSVAPHCLLVTSKRNDFVDGKQKYDLEELLQRALAIKANLCFEFCKVENKVFNIRVFDPLGCIWYDGTDISEAVKSTIARLEYLITVTRKPSKEKFEYRPLEPNENDKKFIEFIKESGETFHRLMCLPPDVKRFVGNASLRFKEPTRCMSGFPAIRKYDIKKQMIVYISRRNVDKTGISEKDFVPCSLDEFGNVAYGGENKPSVDSPVQLRLFEKLTNIDYILHGHCYTKEGFMTSMAIPCGAVEEVNEVLDCINKNYSSLDKDFYVINLKGHGCLIMANAAKLDDMKKVEFYARPLPEIM